ncbi:MAG TPA: hypothetical protein VNS19_10215 [Acidimicrobiales bacterium]|nr:hypothetical protein [Acidimicrobiales bacterium]
MGGRDHRQPSPSKPSPSTLGRWLPALVPLAIAAGFALSGHPTRAAALAAVAGLAAVLVAVGVPVAHLIDRAVHALVHALATLVLGGLYLLAIVPLWAFGRLRRSRLGGAGGWRPRRPGAAAASSFAHDPSLPDRRLRHQLVAAVGVVVLLLGLDYGIGWAWDSRKADAPEPTAAVSQREDQTASSDAGDDGTPADPRTAEPSMASSPWAAAYFRDLQQQSFTEWPFTGVKPVDFTSPYINVRDWARRSWTAPGDEDRPVIWFFGGSGMFGEGQRDDHTIPSELARLAAADGLPVTAVNYGQRGWVHWQEMLLFEQRLDQVDAPDLAAFYDGPNDISAAGRYGDGVPLSLNEYVDGGAAPAALSTQLLAPDDDRSVPSQLWSEYAEHSALRKVGRWMGLLPEPAGAQEADSGGTPASGEAGGGGGGGGSDPSGRKELDPTTFTSDEIAAVAIGTYRRGRDLTDFIAAEHDIPVRHFLQPQYYSELGVWTYIQDHWPQPTTDLTDSVEARRDEVFIDGVHTNELGARLVAEAMWAQLRPDVQRWYDEHS